MDGNGVVYVENQAINPMKLSGPDVDAFTINVLVFSRPKWVSDSDAKTCASCDEKFTQIRRKHHCRNCGCVFCNNCCSEKVPLHHLGYDLERICRVCRPTVNIMIQVQSPQLSTRLDGANALYKLTTTSADIKMLLESGGHHILIHLVKTRDNLIRSVVVKSLQNLCCQPTLLSLLLKCGVMKALRSLLSDTDHQAVELLQNTVTLLSLLCKDPQFKVQVMETDLLEPLLQLCNSHQLTLSLLAMQCLSQVAGNPVTFDQIVDNTRKHHLTKIVKLLSHKEEKMQEVALHTLTHISCGTDWHRQRIMQEDVFQGSTLAKVLRGRPLNCQVLVNACCLLANLASLPQAQGAIQDALQQGLQLLQVQTYDNNMPLLRHLARATGNAALSPQNSQIILNYLPDIIKYFLYSSDGELQHHSFRLIISLMQFQPHETLDILNREGANGFLSCLASRPPVLAAIQQVVQTVTPPLADL